jgi:hypothetical protein
MVRQILPNNNERCYNNFSLTFHQLNTHSLTQPELEKLVLWLPSSSYCMAQWRNSMGAGAEGSPAKRPPRLGDTRSKRLAQSIFLLGQAKQDQVNVPNTPVFVCYSSVWSSQFFFPHREWQHSSTIRTMVHGIELRTYKQLSDMNFTSTICHGHGWEADRRQK